MAFAGRAYIAAPLTLDHDFFRMNLDRLDLGIAEDGTAIGSALTAALNRLRGVESKSRIIILMTDGQNNAGKIPPLTAAEAADALEVKVTIGVGTKVWPCSSKVHTIRTSCAGQWLLMETLKEVAQKTNLVLSVDSF